MKKALFFVESPFQLLNVYEAIDFFKIINYKIFIRYSGKTINDLQIKYLIKEFQIDDVNIISFNINSSKKNLFDFFKIIYLKYYFKYINNNFEIIFIGNLESNFFKLIYKNFAIERIIGLDDGTKTLHLQAEFSKKDLYFNLFTMYDIKAIKKQFIFNNNYNWLKSLRNNKERESDVLFLGSDIVTLKIIDEDYYLKLIQYAITNYGKIIYIPHRNENIKLLNKIKNKSFILKSIDYPVEFYGINENKNINTVISFYSTALYTIMKIYNSEAIAIKFNYDNSEYRYSIDEVYNYYQKYMKVIDL